MTRSFISLLFTLSFIIIALNPCSCSKINGIQELRSKLATISLILYTGTTPTEFKRVLIPDAIRLLHEIDRSRPTVLYMPGFRENPNFMSVLTVIGAYLERQDHNVILADYEEVVAGSYSSAALSGNDIGYTVAQGINRLVAAGLNPTTLHMVGHSLGCQMSGFIARHVNFIVPRITGLDPAAPAFNITIKDLTSTDAAFVDIIHTDAGAFGTAESLGTVNFYPNGGTRIQPGCPIPRLPLNISEGDCDHERSWRYYAESLLNERAFIGLKCSSYCAFRVGLCTSNEKVVMGYGTPTTARGQVYLQTNSRSPFGRGENGMNYVR